MKVESTAAVLDNLICFCLFACGSAPHFCAEVHRMDVGNFAGVSSIDGMVRKVCETMRSFC